MKRVVLNYSGNVGKTTVASNLLRPHMPGATYIDVETQNDSAASLGVEGKKIRGSRFQDIYRQIVRAADVIIDVGSSNAVEFLDGMTRFDESHVEIDQFLLPVTPEEKQQKDTITTIEVLAGLDVESDRIVVLFNRVKRDVGEEFPIVMNYAEEKRCIIHPDIAILDNEIFGIMVRRKTNLSAILGDATDYRAKIREVVNDGGDEKLLSQYTDMHMARMLAKSVSRNFNKVYDLLEEAGRGIAQ
jgi:hypothetical protein